MWKIIQRNLQKLLFNELTLVYKKAASELRKQAGDMFRRKKVKGRTFLHLSY
jgi:hypothetical protein